LAIAIKILILPRMYVYNNGKEQTYNTKSDEARAKTQNACKYCIVIGKGAI
jgi:hypothetical protein